MSKRIYLSIIYFITLICIIIGVLGTIISDITNNMSAPSSLYILS